ncbi:par-6 family cell polarity regulator gamma b, partial [Tachysurus ichikawai]
MNQKENKEVGILFWFHRRSAGSWNRYGAEFRRFSVNRVKPGKFEEFFKLIMNLHRIANMEVMIGYADVHGDLLPINNDDNFCKAVSTAHPLLRIFIQRQ